MGWIIRFSDDAQKQYESLSPLLANRLRSVLFDDWVINGPTADGVRLINGVIFREADFDFGLRLTWLVYAPPVSEILLVKIRPIDR